MLGYLKIIQQHDSTSTKIPQHDSTKMIFQQQLHDAILLAIKTHNLFLSKYLISRDYNVELFNYDILVHMPALIPFYLHKRFLIKTALLNTSCEFGDLIIRIIDPFKNNINKQLLSVLYPKQKEYAPMLLLCHRFLENKCDPETGIQLNYGDGAYTYWMSQCDRYIK